MTRRCLALIALVTLAAPLGGCVVVTPPPAAGPRPAAVWVPGHYAANGAWVQGHWR